MKQYFRTVLLFTFILTTHAQQIPVSNPNFEEGTDAPAGWKLSGGAGEWIADTDAQKVLSVTGNGQDSNYWQSDPIGFEPEKLYRLQFKARGFGATGGTVVSGPAFCNRDLGQATEGWQPYSSLFESPSEIVPDTAWIRLGQFQTQGKVAFDAVSIIRMQAVHAETGGLQLGEGERVSGNTYTFAAPFAKLQTNFSRPLGAHHCTFNTNRWVFSAGDQVTYVHQLTGRRQMSGTVEVVVDPYISGKLIVAADNGSSNWQNVATVTAAGTQTLALPAALFPADHISIRMMAEPVDGSPDGASMQVRGYGYRAEIDGAPANAAGETVFFSEPGADPRLQVELLSLGNCFPGGTNVLTAQVTNTTQEAINTSPTLTVTKQGGQPAAFTEPALVAVGQSVVKLKYDLVAGGIHDIAFTLGDGIPFRIEGQFDVPAIYEASYGQKLPQSADPAGVWWTSSGWKISQQRPMPTAQGDRMMLSAAKNESEAAQLVIRPNVEISGFIATPTPLIGPGGAVIPETNVSVLRERYVQTERPTDGSAAVGLWPDPLPPFAAPITLPVGVNQPLWVRVTVPSGVPAGPYEGIVSLRGNGYSVDVPVHVDVRDFELPTRATCTTTFGFSPENVFKYQRVNDPAQRKQVLDLYWKDFSAHRIAPYNPAPLDPVNVTWPNVDAYKSGANTDVNAAFTPAFDWAAFDAAMTVALDTYGFNSFVAPVQGMGGGTFHSRTEPSMLGYAENTPEYKTAFTNYHKLLQEHLREKNWLDEAYVYWFDEPDPKDYEFVMNGFKRLKESAPDLQRMLTEQPDTALAGGPNIWCPISNAFDAAKAEPLRAQGDKFWWYVCTGPKSPYCTLFLDHPGTELRVWLWQTWQRKIDGILVWQSNYWTSDAAYPDPNLPQDPYADPMSWMSGYDTPGGKKEPWGNGDGRFIYPPESANGRQPETIVAGPVDSIRWEALRDGVEDYEYLAILKRTIDQQEKAGKTVDPSFKALLEVPASITTTATQFTTDPSPIEAQREAIAKAIETVSKL